MPDEAGTLLSLPPEDVPGPLRDWLLLLSDHTALASLELLADGRLVIQALPGVDPRLVARIRLTIAQYEDVLRRLT
jgi:hypothetical protein